MTDNQNTRALEQQIRNTLGSAPEADFANWRLKHGNAIRLLAPEHTPVVSTSNRMPRYSTFGIATATAAVFLLLVGLAWLSLPRTSSFAQTIVGIESAKAITWVRTLYQRGTSADGQRQWLSTSRTNTTYLEPGFYRRDMYDDQGTLKRILIDDNVRGLRMTLDMKHSLFELENYDASEPNFNGPFDWVNEILRNEPIEAAGQKRVDGKTVNVFRRRNLMMGKFNPRNVEDFWIADETKQLVGMSRPGSSVFDPESLEYRDNPPEEKISSMKILGSITKDIVLDADVDPEFFDMTIPDGFTKAGQPKSQVPVTEDELIEWLRVTARVNDDTFLDGILVRDTQKTAEASYKETDDRSEVEKEMGQVWVRHLINGNDMPLWDFIETNTFPENYRYIGKGVKLGSADVIILWYQLKSTGKYRAVYGDLTIKDIAESELPFE